MINNVAILKPSQECPKLCCPAWKQQKQTLMQETIQQQLTENALKPLSTLSAFGAVRTEVRTDKHNVMSFIAHETYCPQSSPAQRCPEHQEATCVSYDWVKHTSHPNVRSV